MTFGTDTRKSKYGLNKMELNEVRVFDTPTSRDRDLIRRSAHNQNVRSDRYYITRAHGDTIHVTRIR
jgi:fibronectin type 3 domain-containing protein